MSTPSMAHAMIFMIEDQRRNDPEVRANVAGILGQLVKSWATAKKTELEGAQSAPELEEGTEEPEA